MTKKIIDCETGEIIERELNEEELAQQDSTIFIDNDETMCSGCSVTGANR
jgi:hypothetical protein